jgi:nucleoid DNA-binding protein
MFMAKKTKAQSARKATAVRQSFTKSQTVSALSDATGLTKKQVSSVLDELGSIIGRHIKKGGAGQFTVPNLMKVKTVRKPATKARKGINPFTKEPTVFKAKPARTVVKVQPLKNLKDMAK